MLVLETYVQGWSPLMVAAAEGYPKLVTWLLDVGNADVNATNNMVMCWLDLQRGLLTGI